MFHPKDRLAEWIQDQFICCLQKTHFRPRDTYRLKVRGWKKIFHANWKQKKVRAATFIPDKMGFKIDIIMTDKEGHHIMIKGLIQEQDTTIIHIYPPNTEAPPYMG